MRRTAEMALSGASLRSEAIHTRPLQLAHGLTIGGDAIVMMAGPCSVESYEQTRAVAAAVATLGGRILRGGAFKPRTSPYSFQGLGLEGLQILRAVADEFDMLVITEALGVEQLPLIVEYGDIIQIGSRNMQHQPLLWAAGETDKPVLLKRGFMSTIDEWLMAAEHVTSRGNERLILCERGIRTFDTATRNVLDVGAITLLKQSVPFPVVADPSHAMGLADLVIPAGRAAVAAGADGLLVEAHENPHLALSDGDQALTLNQLPILFDDIERVGGAIGRPLDRRL